MKRISQILAEEARKVSEGFMERGLAQSQVNAARASMAMLNAPSRDADDDTVSDCHRCTPLPFCAIGLGPMPVSRACACLASLLSAVASLCLLPLHLHLHLHLTLFLTLSPSLSLRCLFSVKPT